MSRGARAGPRAQPEGGALHRGVMLTITTTIKKETPQQLSMRLKKARKRRVRWAEDVVDNEDLCRKKSKCCCIFHRPEPFAPQPPQIGSDSDL